MQTQSKTKTEIILKVMLVLSWVAYIGLLIKVGSLLVSFGISYFNDQAATDLYKGLNLYELRQTSFWTYTCVVSFLIALPVTKAHVVHLIIKTLTKVKLDNPFTMVVALLIERIGQVLIGLWIVAIANNGYISWVEKRFDVSLYQWETSDYLFIAGLVFIIAQIFKRGVELQNENELTV